MYNWRSLSLLGFWSSVTLLLIQPVAAQTSAVRLATSCLPGGVDAPRSQGIVIDRERIEQRSCFHHNLQQLLTTEVPGFSAFSRKPVLRGRRVRVLVDGVPVAADDELLSTLNPDLVERIEVIPGASVLC
jgi:hypothetical protein